MKRVLIIFLFFVNGLSAERRTTSQGRMIPKKQFSRLGYELEIVKKFPGAIKRYFASPKRSLEDQGIVQQGALRLFGAGLLMATPPVVYVLYERLLLYLNSTNKSSDFGPSKNEQIGAITQAIARTNPIYIQEIRDKRYKEITRWFNTPSNNNVMQVEDLEILLETAIAQGDARTVQVFIDQIKQHGKQPSFKTARDCKIYPLGMLLIKKREGLLSVDNIRETNKILVKLIENGADPNDRYPEEQWTLLMDASVTGLEHIVRTLIFAMSENGKDLNRAHKEAVNSKGETAADLVRAEINALKNDSAMSKEEQDRRLNKYQTILSLVTPEKKIPVKERSESVSQLDNKKIVTKSVNRFPEDNYPNKTIN